MGYCDPSGYVKETKKAVSELSYDEVIDELKVTYKDFVKNKNLKFPKENNSKTLLPNELEYGSHGLNNKLLGETGDNITGHHMPSNKFMKDKCDVSTNTAYSMFLEQISPGTGGRHRRTFTYGLNSTTREYQLYYRLTPRDALAFDMNDARRILKEDGLYNKETRNKLRQYIQDYKNDPKSKGVFNKDNKLNEASNRVKNCLKK